MVWNMKERVEAFNTFPFCYLNNFFSIPIFSLLNKQGWEFAHLLIAHSLIRSFAQIAQIAQIK